MADIASSSWHPADDANSEAAPLGAPEGMAPSGVNNTMRAMMGAIKRWYNQQIPLTTAGTASAYTAAYAVAPGALVEGDSHTITFHVANAAGATLNVGGLGAKPLHYYSAGAWRVVPAALWGADQILRVAYHTSSSAYRLIDKENRTGEVTAFAGATAPAGSLLCYGQAISRTAYAGLFAALSTAHGVGDGTSTFNLPDLRGRVAAGLGNMGGTESGRLNTYVASTLGAAGGVQQSASAAVSVSGSFSGTGNASINGTTAGAAGDAGTVVGGGAVTVPGPAHTHTMSFDSPVTVSGSISGSGSTAVATNVQPTMSLNYVIRV